MKTEKRPFNIIIKAISGNKIIETIEVDVIVKGNDEFLTPESSQKIEDIRNKYINKIK